MAPSWFSMGNTKTKAKESPVGIKHLLVSLYCSITLTSCYVDTPTEQPLTDRQKIPGKETLGLKEDPSLCQKSPTTGCFDGYLAVKQNFSVEGQQFFNADDFGNRFKDLLSIKEQEGEVSFDTPIDNQNFYQGFTYDLTGEVNKSGTIRAKNTISLSNLLPGQYDLRVQRPIKFTLTHKNQDDGSQVQKLYCATLFSDITVEIRDDQRTWLAINDFKLYFNSDECKTSTRLGK